MTPGQTRVLVLLLILAAMETVLQPGIKSALSGAWVQFNAGINSGAQAKT